MPGDRVVLCLVSELPETIILDKTVSLRIMAVGEHGRLRDSGDYDVNVVVTQGSAEILLHNKQNGEYRVYITPKEPGKLRMVVLHDVQLVKVLNCNVRRRSRCGDE